MTAEPKPSPESQLPSFPLDLGSMRNMVEYRFTLLDAYVDVNGLPTFVVVQEPMKQKFTDLLHDLRNHNLMAKIRKVEDKLVISIFPKPDLGNPRKIIHLVLLLATIATVGVASYALIFDVDPRLTVALFAGSNLVIQVILVAMSILGIIVLHELGHVVAIRHHGMDATLPYFIPAPPPIGTFGAVISLRAPPANRDQLFDLGFSGPLAGFVATVGVAIFAYLTSPLITDQEASTLVAANLLSTSSWPHIPLLVDLLGQLSLRPIAAGHVLVLAQVAFAANVGALITFLNLLPVWMLDGGHISRALLGSKGHKLAAFVGFGILAVTGYWVFAVFLGILIFLRGRRGGLLEGVEPLDDISPLTNTRKALFALALAMLVLSLVIF